MIANEIIQIKQHGTNNEIYLKGSKDFIFHQKGYF